MKPRHAHAWVVSSGILGLALAAGAAHAEDIAFIVGNVGLTNAGDALINDFLVNQLGHNVTLVDQNDDAATTLAAANAADLAIVSESVGSGSINTEVKDSTSPVLLYEAYLYDDMQWMPGNSITNNYDPNDDGGNTPVDLTDSITIVDPDHPLAAGLPAGNVQVYTAPGELTYGRLTAPGADVVATVPGDPDAALIFAFEQGTTALDGSTIPARRVGFFSSGITLSQKEFTPAGWSLFEAAVNYALDLTTFAPGDFNEDGVVDERDYFVLSDNLGGHLDGPVGRENGDMNRDGKVDTVDFGLFKEAFPGALAQAQGIPEPSAFALALVAVATLLACRRRT